MIMNVRPQRFIALIMVLSPWIYIPSAFKEVIFIALGVSLFVATLDLKKKKQVVKDVTFIPQVVEDV